MRRTSSLMHAAGLGLLLLCLAAPALARNGVNAAANGESSCTDSDDTSTERARQAAESRGKANTAAPAKPSARPAASANAGNRASSGDDGPTLRSHASRWHSFLPGMFR